MASYYKYPVAIPKGVKVEVNGQVVVVNGPKGKLEHAVHPSVHVVQDDAESIRFESDSSNGPSKALVGTSRALINNMIIGVSDGYQKKLQLIGVGYRAQAQGSVVNLTLGFSHPVNHQVPAGITVETPSQTEIVVSGTNKQLVGQVAAKIRAYRPPEPYKGKGVRYSDERVVMKEAKKA